jgi:hypothetical protein
LLRCKEGYSTAEKIIAMDSNEIVTLDKNFASGNINDGFSTKKLSLNAIYFEMINGILNKMLKLN